MRISEAGLALVTRTPAGGAPEFLTQWSRGWGMYSLVGGHREPGETFRECVAREVGEELGLAEGVGFAVATGPVKPAQEYTAVSGGAGVLTLYRVELYAVTLLTADAEAQASADPANRWLTRAEVDAGATADGQPVSAQVRTVFTLFGVL